MVEVAHPGRVCVLAVLIVHEGELHARLPAGVVELLALEHDLDDVLLAAIAHGDYGSHFVEERPGITAVLVDGGLLALELVDVEGLRLVPFAEVYGFLPGRQHPLIDADRNTAAFLLVNIDRVSRKLISLLDLFNAWGGFAAAPRLVDLR